MTGPNFSAPTTCVFPHIGKLLRTYYVLAKKEGKADVARGKEFPPFPQFHFLFLARGRRKRRRIERKRTMRLTKRKREKEEEEERDFTQGMAFDTCTY